jgi:hypothetical protein
MGTSEVMSRRKAFSLLGLATFSLAAAPALVTVLTVSEADAQASPPLAPPEQDPKAGPQTGGGTRGMRRRKQRRAARRARRSSAPQ